MNQTISIDRGKLDLDGLVEEVERLVRTQDPDTITVIFQDPQDYNRFMGIKPGDKVDKRTSKEAPVLRLMELTEEIPNLSSYFPDEDQFLLQFY